MDSGTLFVVSTPIGNLEDLAPRARQVLEHADLIAAEDTRHTGRLLSHFGIKATQFALHEHNEDAVVAQLVSRLKEGKTIALVSDAGTPLISDPGFRLVRAAHAAGITVSPIPGPSALSAALSVAGLPTDRVCFEGFLPSKKIARRKKLEKLRDETRTLVFYESVHRIIDMVTDLNDVLGAKRQAFIGRELSKIHEQCVHAQLGELQKMFGNGKIPVRGEFVIVVEGSAAGGADKVCIDMSRLMDEVSAALPAGEAAELISLLSGRRRNEIYRQLLAKADPKKQR